MTGIWKLVTQIQNNNKNKYVNRLRDEIIIYTKGVLINILFHLLE